MLLLTLCDLPFDGSSRSMKDKLSTTVRSQMIQYQCLSQQKAPGRSQEEGRGKRKEEGGRRKEEGGKQIYISDTHIQPSK